MTREPFDDLTPPPVDPERETIQGFMRRIDRALVVLASEVRNLRGAAPWPAQVCEERHKRIDSRLAALEARGWRVALALIAAFGAAGGVGAAVAAFVK